MGWLSGDQLQINTATSSSSPTGWVPRAFRQNYEMAQEVANRPYQAYEGDLVAGLTPDQLAANNAVRAQMGSYQPFVSDAASAYRANLNPMGSSVQDYMNPFTQSVVADTMGALDRQRLNTNQQNAAAAAKASAFGGSRHGVVDALTNEGFFRQSGELANQMNVQNFTQAQRAFDADRDRAMSAATNLANLGVMNQSMGLRDAAALQGIGAQQQALDQARLDENVARYMDRRNYPLTQLNILQSALSGAPFATRTVENTPVGYGGGGLANFLGDASSALGALNNVGGLLSEGSDLLFGSNGSGGFFDWLGRQFGG